MPQVETFSTGAIGGVILQACRDGKLGKDEVIEVCRRMAFPPPFATLCINFLTAGTSSPLAGKCLL
jgi:hypothetical protein